MWLAVAFQVQQFYMTYTGIAEKSLAPPPEIAQLILLKRMQNLYVHWEICGVIVDCVCGMGCFDELNIFLNRQNILIIVQVHTLRFAI